MFARIQPARGAPVASTLYMALTGLVLFFLPFLNGLFGGVAGGFKATSLGRALMAALAASVMVPATLLFLYSFEQPDFLRLFYGLGFEGWAALHAVGQVLGAVFGHAVNPDRLGVSAHVRAPRRL